MEKQIPIQIPQIEPIPTPTNKDSNKPNIYNYVSDNKYIYKINFIPLIMLLYRVAKNKFYSGMRRPNLEPHYFEAFLSHFKSSKV